MTVVETHDPGGKHRWPLLPGMRGDAVFSSDGTRRQVLVRRWNEQDAIEPFALWVGCNPSTAGKDVDDPTVRREVLRTRDWLGLSAYVKVNVCDYRATDPADLLGVDYPSGPDNEYAIRDFAHRAEVIIAAWGALPPRLRVHATRTMATLREVGKPVMCLGLTKEGFPRHPLYVRGDAPLIPFNVGELP